MPRRHWITQSWKLLSLSAAALLAASLLYVVHANPSPAPVTREIKLGNAKPGTLYAFTAAVKDPAQLQDSDAVQATIKDAQGVIETKYLHTADLDFYLTVRPRAAGPRNPDLRPRVKPAPEISASLHKIIETA